MFATDAFSAAPIQLDWRDEDGTITVTPSDEDRFSIRISRAVRILQLADRADQFGEQFRLLLKMIGRWLSTRQDVREAHVTLRDGGLALIVVSRSARYDDDFEDAISEIDLTVAQDNDLDLIQLEVLSLPNVSDKALASFIDPSFSLVYSNGDGSGSHSAGE